MASVESHGETVVPENLWDGLDDAKAAASDASLNASWKLDPERQAKVQALARQMGVAPATADTEFDQLDAMRKREAAAALLEKAPATRQFLTNPDHAAIAHDQTEALARIEQKAKRTPAGSIDLIPRGEVFGFDYLKAFAESPVGNLSSGIVERAPQLAAGLGRTLFGLVDRPADLLASGAEALGIPTIIDFTPQGVKGRMQTAAERQSLTGGGYAEQAIRAGEGFKTAYKPGASWEDVKRQPVTKFLPFALEQGIVSAPDMAAAVLALPAYVAARTGEIGVVRATNDGRQEATVEDLFAALPAAAGSAALERLGTRGIIGLDDALKGGLKGVPAAVGKASLKEGLTEAGQQVLESLGATVGTKKGVDGAALLDETLAAAAGGAGFGGVVRAGTGTLEAFSGESRKAESAKDDAEKLDDLVQEVTANPLTARDPEAMKAFLDGVTDGEVHIPAKAVMAYLQARRFDDVDAVLDEWGIADQMQEAMAADADIVVDTSVYLSKIAPQHHDAFREDLRVGSGSMSLREAAEFDAGRDGGLQDAAQKVLDQSAAEQEAAAPAEKVYQTLYGQALEAGYVPDVARQYAELWAARYNARAARSPDLYANALDAFNASKVSVRADMPEALKTRIDKIDVVINALRARAKPDAGEALLGPSLLTFVSKQGGIVDPGGELAGMDAGTWHKGKVGKRKIIRDVKDPADAVNHGPERVAERAFDAGYITEPTQEALLAAVREELAGRLQFPSDARNQTTQAREDFGQAVDQLDEILGRLGLDVDTATNEQIKAAVEAYAADPQGAMGYEQEAQGEIQRVLDAAAADGNQQQVAGFGRASRWLIDQAAAAGFDVGGYEHTIDTSAVRHIFKSHGNPAVEASRGQVAVTEADILSIPSLLAAPDAVVFGTQSKMGRDQIVYLKAMPDGSTIYLEEMRNRRGQLNAVSMRKYPPAMNADSILATLDPNVRNNRGAEIKIVDVPPGAKAVETGQSFDQSAYHGSPHVFDRFSTDAMGTGEGAQAYGWGLYFAGRKAIAEHYRNKLAKGSLTFPDDHPLGGVIYRDEQQLAAAVDQIIEADGETSATRPETARELYHQSYGEIIANAVAVMDDPVDPQDMPAIIRDIGANEADNVRRMARESGEDLSATAQAIEADYAAAGRVFERLLADGIKKASGRLYQVDIPEDNEYLLWDAPLNEQPEKVRAALSEAGIAVDDNEIRDFDNALVAALVGDGSTDLPKQPQNPSGEDIYRQLSRAQGGDARASKALLTSGIAGIKFLDGASRAAGDGTYNYVVFDDSRVQITSYEQPADGSGMAPRGRIDLMSDGSRIITMFESRDLSTLLHEGGHLWLEELRQDAAMGSAGAMAELDIINDWFAKNGLVDPVDQHEAWARASEAYLMEGKAPSQALKPAFSRFRSWLLSIYRTVAGLNTPINDDIRGVMDRLLATDAEIVAARQSASADPMFTTATEAGMTEAEFTAYNKAVARSKDAAHDGLLVKVMNAITRERTAEWKAEAGALRPEAVETVDAAPEMRALNWLRSNRQALSREAVIDVLGDASALAMLPKGVPPLISDKAGIHPDSLADVAGYQSGQEMLLGLMSIEAERQAMKAKDDKRSVRAARIDAEVKRIQTERHGDPFTDGSIEREAMDAIHHERQGEVLAEEIRALGRKVGQNPTPLQMLREWARATVAGKKMRDATRTDRYLRAERKAANAAQQAAAKGDNATALKEKQTQTLNHLLYNESTKAAAMAERAVKLFSRYAKARTLKGMDQDYLEQIQGLLEQYDFAATTLRGADRRASLAAWVKAKQDAGEEVLVPEALLTRATKTSYVNMTMEELTGLYDAVRSIAHLGRLKQKLLDGKEQRDFEAVIDEVTSQTQDLPTVRDLAIANPKENWGALADAALIKVETMLDWLDRGDVNGVFNRLLIRPATDAANLEGQLREKISKALGEHREAVPKAQRKAWLKAWTSPLLLEPRTGQPLKLQRGDLIAMALNVGNASNLDKLARGYGWNPDTILNVLNQNLTKEEWAYVQNVWTTVGSLWPDIAATERKLTGVEPEAVIPQAVVTSFGTIPGGYYPVVYDYERTTEAPEWAAKEAADMFNGVFYSTGTPKGHTQARTGFAAPITLSVSRVLGGHVNKVIKRIAYAEFVMSAKKIIEDGRIRQIIQAKLGPEYYNLLMPWLQRQVVDQVVPSRELAGVEKFVRKARVNFQIVAMGFRVSTGLAQVAGLTSSAAVIGPEWVAKGMSEAVRMMATDGNFDFVFSRSPEMEQRGRELDRDLRDAMRDFEDGEGLLDPIRRAAFAHIGFMDRYVVAIPTWLGAYNKAKSQHMSEDDASAAADKAVRSSQGSGRAKDLAAIQAPNSEFMKLFTLFYSYFNVQYQRQRDIGRMAARGDIVPALNMSFWMLIMAPLASAIMTGDLPDFEDDEGWLEWAAWKVFGNMWAGVPLVRDVTGYIERKGRGIYTEYSPTPLVGVVGSVEDTLGDIIKLVKDGEPGDRWIKHAIQTPGYFVGLPTGQASSTVQYLFDMIDGDQNPENVGEFLYGLAKGPQKDQE